ncbi:DUF3817 domain-containing protein [Sphingosinicella sp. BN140058]|nr:DUF3817 domain-containing protein [Sphingosinicella sp. BN140058]
MRRAALFEGATLLGLLTVAVPAKHLFGYAAATHVMGPVHGFAFLVYAHALIVTVSGGGWTRSECARLAVAAFVPLGAVANVGLLRRKEAEFWSNPT